MATDVRVGITWHSGSLIESVEVTGKMVEHVLLNSNGNAARVGTNNRTNSFSVKGHGSLTAVLGIPAGGSGLSNVTGGVSTITEIKQDQSNSTWDGWSYSGNNYPVAQSVTLSQA